MIPKRRQRACWVLCHLMFLFLAAPYAAAAPNMVGTWQGSIPGIYSIYCFNEQVTINIVQQCGNLFRGSATVAGSTTNVVGSIKDGTSINIHGNKADGSMVMVFGDYQPGPLAKINVTYFYAGNISEIEYDVFQLSYGGGPIMKVFSAVLYLLLLD